MSESLKFAGKNDAGNVTPISVENNGNIRSRRRFHTDTTEIYSDVLSTTSMIYIPAFDATDSGLVAIVVWNRSGVDLSLQINSVLSNGSGGAVVSIRNAQDELPIFTIPTEHQVIITPEDLPMLNYAKYINVSLKASAEPTGTSNTWVRVIHKG